VDCLYDTSSNENVGSQRSDGKRRAAAEVELPSLMMKSVTLESYCEKDLWQSTRVIVSEDIGLLARLLPVLDDAENCNELKLDVVDILGGD